MLTIITFVLVLGVLIFVHELGHFISAIKSGVEVEEFGFGYPPRILGVKVSQKKVLQKIAQTESIQVEVSDEQLDSETELIKEKVTDTIREIDQPKTIRHWQWFWGNKQKLSADNTEGIIYSINLLPLGGFVKITGESGDASDNPRSFANQKPWKKSLILSAGVLMNFLLAWILLAVGFYFGLPQAIENNTPDSQVTYHNVVIAEVLPNSPAAKQGLEMGDEILQVDQQPVNNIDQVFDIIKNNPDKELLFRIKRQATESQVAVKPEILPGGQTPMIGIGMVNTGVIHYGFFGSIWQGLKTTGFLIVRVAEAFYELLKNLFSSGRVSADLSGPIGVAVLTGQVAKMGWIYLLQFMAILSINLGVLNILPIPALDGGRLLFVLIEKIRRRRINEKVEAIVHNTGFALLMLLIIFITFKDIGRYGAGIWQALKNIF
ncbi:MAG: RIP metalloprotease RseP [Patescibacteria group bacterium]